MSQYSYIIPVGVPSAVFVGNYNDAQPLKKIFAERTGGIKVQENYPRTYVPSLNATVQSGIHTVTLQIAFLAENQLVWNIARGLSVYDSNMNNTEGNQQYTIFLLYADKKVPKCFFFPQIQVTSPLDVNENKDKPTIMPITFTAFNRDPSVVLLQRDSLKNFLYSNNYSSFLERKPSIFG